MHCGTEEHLRRKTCRHSDDAPALFRDRLRSFGPFPPARHAQQRGGPDRRRRPPRLRLHVKSAGYCPLLCSRRTGTARAVRTPSKGDTAARQVRFSMSLPTCMIAQAQGGRMDKARIQFPMARKSGRLFTMRTVSMLTRTTCPTSRTM